jgi:aspartokinase-like uncharacterized kinase
VSRPRVLKLGGSLLGLADLRPRLLNWLQAHPHSSNLIVVGGGQIVDSVRALDDTYSLDPTFTHWLCVDLLESTARVAAQLFPEFRRIASPREMQRFLQIDAREFPQLTAIVAVKAFYDRRHSEPRLPADWSTTSDSLAALLATQLGASELVLFKSTDVPTQRSDPSRLAEAGIVDPVFPLVANQIPKVTLVNLRKAKPQD